MTSISGRKTHFSEDRRMTRHSLQVLKREKRLMEQQGTKKAKMVAGKLDNKDNLLNEFEKWFSVTYEEINLVHFYCGKADIAIEKIEYGDEVIVAVVDKMKDIEKETRFKSGEEDIAVIWKHWKEESDEVCLDLREEQLLQGQQIEELNQIEKYLEENSEDLFKKHSNLEMIMASTYRIRKGKIVKEPCIVLYCSCKGILPINEPKFPATIHEIKTDVREGFFHLDCNFNDDVCAVSKDLLNPLRMGASIGKKGERGEGTLGGFVKSNEEVGFVTCAHNFYCTSEMETSELPKDPITVVQPTHGQEGSQECGETLRSVSSFSNKNDENITVDATLVRLTERHPAEQLFFADLFTAKLKKYGFSRATFPQYINKNPLDLREIKDREVHLHKEYLKCGTTTGLTMGNLQLNLFRGRHRDVRQRGSRREFKNEIYENQLVILGENFSAPGDSGSFVFQVSGDYKGRLDCIGMLVGACGKNKRAVTPIISVLKALDVSLIPFP